MTKEKPWWKQPPVAAPDAPRAVRPPPDDPDDGAEGELDDGDGDGDGDGDDDAGHDDEVAAATTATELADGESTTMQGSGAQPYVLKNTGGVYSCSCPAWRNQGAPIERRSCKHLRRLRGDAAETARVGTVAAPARAPRAAAGTTSSPQGTAPAILLAHPWDNIADLTGWWMSEKLDGVRAYWDGARLVSRLGNEYHAPDWFVARLPRVPLDGELWAGRKKFQRAVSIARRQDRSDAWRELTYVVFDAPAVDAPFEQRLELVRQQLEAHRSAHARWHPHERCTGLAHLRAELARIEALGGEGLMMRQPGSRYEIGRSWTLRKVKTFHDAEARVIAHVRGAGRHDGRLGSLQCEMPDGTVFHIGTGLSDVERNTPPPIGSIVTYRYQELSNDGVPRFPSYVGMRHDLPWPPPDVPVRPPAAAAANERNRRIFVRGVTMWSIELDDRTVKVVEETPGAAAETTARRNTSPAGAWRDAERLIAEKLAAGYVEIIP